MVAMSMLSTWFGSAPVTPGFAGDGLGAYVWAFGQGVLVDLTPCVYPLIPITVAVFGAKGVSRRRALVLATAYVLGMALFYTALGVIVSLTGAQFGAWLGNPVVVLPIVGLLLMLAASMFGAFDLQLPTSIQNRLGTVGGSGLWGAFTMGLVSGLISAPCTGPVLLGLLTYIAAAAADGRGITHGASLLFVYALGMGSLFFAVALGASLFRPGAWMEHVKSVFAIALCVMAIWFLRPVVPAIAGVIIHEHHGVWIGIVLAAFGMIAGAVHLSFHGSLAERLRKGLAVLVTVFGATVTLNAALYVPDAQWNNVTSFAELETALDRAANTRKPVVIDFAAAWCLPCKELELQTLHDPRVESLLAQRFELVKIDVTDPNDEQMAMQSSLASQTLPSVVVYASNSGLDRHYPALRRGDPLPAPAVKFDSLVQPDEFLRRVSEVR